jgi:hypothetical protein
MVNFGQIQTITPKGTLRNIMYYNILAVLPVIDTIGSVTLKLM